MIYKFSISFLIGIVFDNLFHLGWTAALLVILITVATYLLSFRTETQSQTLGFLIVGLAVALGILRMSLASVEPDKELLSQVGRKISFEGMVLDEPDIRDSSIRYTVFPFLYRASVSECTDIFLLKNSPCSPQSGSRAIQKRSPSKSKILIVADRFPEYKYGDLISVSGRIDLPKNFVSQNDIEFDYVSYLYKDKIHFIIYYPMIEKMAGDGGNKAVSLLYSFKNTFIREISEKVPEPNSSFLAGIIFGVKQSLGQELLDDFRKVGLIHVVVLSGYNITIIAVGIFWALSHFGRRNLSLLVSTIFIILFATMVGWGATVVRAVIMALISILTVYLGRPADALRWLFIAGFFMLLWNPLILFYDPSFQLSFMATLGLILFSPSVYKLISESKLRKFIPEKFALREIVSSTLAVQFFVLPLLIKMSGFVSLISFLINPTVLPLIPWAMGAGALTGALGLLPLVGSILSWPFGVISYVLTQIIISITEFSASLSLATLQTGSISLWLILIWYLVYGILYWKLKK
jgi:competence protein ComEC